MRVQSGNARGFHTKLWPGVEAPQVVEGCDQLRTELSEGAVSTSLLMAFATQFVSFDKRLPEYRLQAYSFIKAVVGKLCSLQPTLKFLHASTAGEIRWYAPAQFLRTPSGCLPWDFFEQYLAFTWNSDYASEGKPWVSSAGPVHLADFIAFALLASPK